MKRRLIFTTVETLNDCFLYALVFTSPLLIGSIPEASYLIYCPESHVAPSLNSFSNTLVTKWGQIYT
jgi:hypothetical protein